jgi:hypothetical protein
MMNFKNSSLIVATSLLAFADAAYGQVVSLTCSTDGTTLETVCGTESLENEGQGSYNGTAFGFQTLEDSTGSNNTAVGTWALEANLTGTRNTAVGSLSLRSNTIGTDNTAIGFMANDSTVINSVASFVTAAGSGALENNAGAYNTGVGFNALQGAPWSDVTFTGGGTGTSNTGIGAGALFSFSSGHDNTASGYWALYSNSTGVFNTASGSQALYSNSVAANNTAVGYQALYSNDSDAADMANDNTATGFFALYSNVDGYENTALGAHALHSNLAGGNNTATGYAALYANAGGNNNTASGYQALYANTTGSNNIAMGYEAGYKLVAGSDNIDIGNEGAAGDNKAIRIGKEGTQNKTFIAGIYSNATVSGLAVVIGSNGELGAVSSSERFKTAIEPMGSNTERLQQLRPVTFRYKIDPPGTLRYGLIAEEVAKVYPELVVRDKNDRIDGVRYDELAPLLLNEMQKQQQTIAAQSEHAAAQDAEIRDLKKLVIEMQTGLLKLQAKDELLAQR